MVVGRIKCKVLPVATDLVPILAVLVVANLIGFAGFDAGLAAFAVGNLATGVVLAVAEF